jgi:Ca2+-dependent lipid-binding protein
MSLFKKLSEAAKSTASTVGSKSAEMVATGKLIMEKKKLEGKAHELMTEVGGIYYHAYVEGTPPDTVKMNNLCDEIKVLERHIHEIDETIHAENQETQQAENN